MRLGKVRILKVEPTVFFANREPLRQLVWLTLLNDGADAVEVDWLWSVNGESDGPSRSLPLQPGLCRAEIDVPDLRERKEITLKILYRGKVLAQTRRLWNPQRKWRVFLVKSSHEDIGYEDFLWIKQKEIADFMEIALTLAKASFPAADDPLSEPNYRYWLETLLFTRYFEEERSGIALRRLVETAIKPGLLPLAGAPNGITTHWMDYEELVRMTYPGRRMMKDRFGLDLDLFAIVDNPSLSWSSCQILARSGFRYAVRFGQAWRTGGNNDYAATGLPPVFWWLGPDGESRVLFAWRSHYRTHFWFGQSDRAFADLDELGAASVQAELAAIESGEKLGPYPWDAVLVPSYRDHEAPAWDKRALLQWRKCYRYPEIRIGDPRDFMEHMEKTHGPALPVLRGDLNNFSGDYATIDPEAHGRKRRAARLLPLAEGLSAINGMAAPQPFIPPAAFHQAYQRLFDFDEHSWPTKPPARDIHQFNAQWGKILEGQRALADARHLAGRALRTFASLIATSDQPEVAVVNGLLHPRDDVANLPPGWAAVRDPATGEAWPAQRTEDGGAVFVARAVPGFGYRSFRLKSGLAAPSRSVRPRRRVLENQFYRIRFHETDGSVEGWHDLALGRELVDPDAPYRFNQLLRVVKDGPESREGTTMAATGKAVIEFREGPVFAEMKSVLPVDGWEGAVLQQTVRMYADLKRVDIVNKMSNFGFMHSPKGRRRYQENVFFAFPFHIPRFIHRAEYAGGVVRPYDDQLRWGSHDFICANRWVNVSNDEFGVTMALHNAPVIHCGEIRYNAFSVNNRPLSSHLFSHAWSNRMDGLHTLCPADMETTVAYSLTSSSGPWNAAASHALGWQAASPLECCFPEPNQTGPFASGAAGFLEIDSPNVQLTVLKESEQPGRGWILRLVETAGRATMACLDVSKWPVDSAFLCDLVENDVKELPFEEGGLRLEMAPFSHATVRIYPSGIPPGEVFGLAATAVDDQTVRLSWEPLPGATAYHVFRTTDPAEPASGHTLVARSKDPALTDTGLFIDTDYIYRVAAVASGNLQGPPCEPVRVHTSPVNSSPPGVVRELGVVRLGPDRLMVCWRKVPDPDVARYHVFRSSKPVAFPEEATHAATVKPGGHYLEHWIDAELHPGETRFYLVVAEDWAGNRQARSPVASGTTPAMGESEAQG